MARCTYKACINPAQEGSEPLRCLMHRDGEVTLVPHGLLPREIQVRMDEKRESLAAVSDISDSKESKNEKGETMGRKRGPTVDVNRVRELAAGGLNNREIAERLQVTVNSISRVRRLNGISSRRGFRAKKAESKAGVLRSPDLPMTLKGDDPAVTVSVRMTEGALDAMWAGLDMQTKARAMELLFSTKGGISDGL